MPTFKVKVKWNKEVYQDMELCTEEPPVVFKAQLFALTGVNTDRQKLLFKGMTVKDDDWNNLQIKDGITLLLMGSKEELPEVPKEQIVFMEDMNDNELASALQLPAGLTNLGNTCYMNATVQCLRTVPELIECLKNYSGRLTITDGSLDASQSLTIALRDLYEAMDKSSTIAPLILLQVLHLAFPRFAEKGESGGFIQHDANECWTELIRMIQQRLKVNSSSVQTLNFIDQYFGGTFDVEMKCTETDSEEPVRSTENFLQLSCFISTDVKYLQSGLKLRLKETIEKFSPTLNKNSKYEKTSKLSRLPAYLAIQFVRFFYKERGSVNAKILKDIKFTLNLDVFELCTTSLQDKLIPMRHKFKEIEDKQLEETRNKTNKQKKEKEDETKAKYKHKYSFDDDIGSNNSGFYDLQAVLTHKGRSSSSGHYVGWIRRKPDEWFKCDDDVVTLVNSDEILKLSGGGDWHSAYVLLYGPRILLTDEPLNPTDIQTVQTSQQ
ncbi:ubiquitin carboxyl-terminal hydrolase 14-like [Oppia nitens]|uniref:ubiquitin carboxyl-terminal hydrolase 14-like n=1 Tax=Oppia nitens TaxID=1686743 RepID=UPI0023DBD850|nr:ubiquitin carboxyl-terminal hydrolase 14-like [Oppia nitens]